MTLIVEDGTARADAEAYCSVAAADARHAARGVTTWAALSTEQREQYLRLATDHMSQFYRSRWAGTRVSEAQALDWPRYNVLRSDGPSAPGVYPSDAVPAEVVAACADLALRALTEPLSEDVERGVLSERVDSLAITYAQGVSRQKRFSAIEAALRPFMTSTGTLSVLRA